MRGRLEAGRIDLARSVALFERQARVAGGFTLGLGLGKGRIGSIAVAKLALQAAVEVPAGQGRDRYHLIRQAKAGDLVAVRVDGRNQGSVGLVDLRRRVRPMRL